MSTRALGAWYLGYGDNRATWFRAADGVTDQAPPRCRNKPERTDADYRKLCELQGADPMVPVLSRGAFCPKDRQQHRLLVRSARRVNRGGELMERLASGAVGCWCWRVGAGDHVA